MNASPGQQLAARVSKLEGVLYGNGKLGIVGRVLILWRSYIWVAVLIAHLIGVLVGMQIAELKP